MDLNGMNSSITPLSTVVQLDRPGRWLNWDAARVLDMIRGSYLSTPTQTDHPGSGEPAGVIDPPGGGLGGMAALRDAVLFQANTSDHNPAVHVGLGPQTRGSLRHRR